MNHETLADIEDVFDLEEIAKGVMSACATFESIILKTSSDPGFKKSYWLVTEDGDERSLQSVEDSSQMSQMEAMFLPAQVRFRVSHLRR